MCQFYTFYIVVTKYFVITEKSGKRYGSPYTSIHNRNFISLDTRRLGHGATARVYVTFMTLLKSL